MGDKSAVEELKAWQEFLELMGQTLTLLPSLKTTLLSLSSESRKELLAHLPPLISAWRDPVLLLADFLKKARLLSLGMTLHTKMPDEKILN